MEDASVFENLTKASNETVIMTIEHLQKTVKEAEMASFLKSIMDEMCEEFHFCKHCLGELESREFDKGWSNGWYCPNCEVVYGKVAI